MELQIILKLTNNNIYVSKYIYNLSCRYAGKKLKKCWKSNFEKIFYNTPVKILRKTCCLNNKYEKVILNNLI